MAYLSRRQLEALGEPIGDMSAQYADGTRRFYGGGKDGGGDAPDYTPMAQASKESAQIMAALGEKQLAEGKRQYDQNIAISKPIIEAQTGLMNQAYQQGKQNYDTFQAEGRPVQQTMLYDALGLSSDEISQYNALRQQEQAAYTNAINKARTDYQTYLADYAKNNPTAEPTYATVPTRQYDYNGDGRSDAYDQQLATAYNGAPYRATSWGMDGPVTQQYNPIVLNQSEIDSINMQNAIAKGMYEANKAKGSTSGAMTWEQYSAGVPGADNSGSSALLSKLTTGAKDRQLNEAANTAMADARQGTTQQMNQLVRQGLRYGYSPAKLASLTSGAASQNALGIASAANQARTQADAKRTAKLGDVYNTYAGLGSQAPAFYNAGTQAGNSAMNNQMAPGQAYMGAMGQGANTIGQGRQLYQQGLGSILNAQTSVYNNSQDSSGGLGGLFGAASNLGAAYIMRS